MTEFCRDDRKSIYRYYGGFTRVIIRSKQRKRLKHYDIYAFIHLVIA